MREDKVEEGGPVWQRALFAHPPCACGGDGDRDRSCDRFVVTVRDDGREPGFVNETLEIVLYVIAALCFAAAAFTTRRRATTAVRELMRRHPTGDLVLVGHATCLSLVAADLTGTAVDPRTPTALGFPDVVTVEMPRPSRLAPLTLRSGLLVALVLAIADLVAWKLTGRVGWVLVPTGVVAALAAVPSRTRELGVSLLAAVLLSAFVVTVVLLGVIRMPA